MNIGMLWFDNDPKTTLSVKIEKAITHYREKYKEEPTLVLVHPKALEGVGEQNFGITVRPYRPVLPGHLWIGMKEKDVY